MKTLLNLKRIGSRLWMLAVSLFAVFAVTGCNEEDMPFIVLDDEVMIITSDVTKHTIDVKANVTWTAKSNAEWCKVINGYGYYKGQFEILVEPNKTTEERNATITVSGDGAEASVLIRQTPINATLYLSEDHVTFTKEAGSYGVAVVSNHNWSVVSSSDWCTTSVESGKGTTQLDIMVEENVTGKERKAVLSFICEMEGNPEVKTIEVTQAASSFFLILPNEEYTLTKEMADLKVPYKAGGNAVEIQPSTNAGWLQAALGQNGEIDIHVEENATGLARTAVLAVTATSTGNDPIIRKVTFTQGASDSYLVLPVEKYDLNKEADTLQVPFKVCGSDVKVDFAPNVNWIEAEEGADGTFTARVAENTTGKAREGFVAVTAVANGKEPVVINVRFCQSATDSYLSLPVKEYNVGKNETELEIPYEAKGENLEIVLSDNTDWISAVLGAENTITATINENTTGEAREGYITVTANTNGSEPLTEIVKISQSATENILDVLVNEITLKAVGDSIRLPFYTNTEVDIRCSSDWIKAELAERDLKIAADTNITGYAREGYVTVSVISEKGDKISKAITVKQNFLETKFEFGQELYNMNFMENSMLVSLISTGKWEMDKNTKLPVWIRITPTEGEDNSTLEVFVKSNPFTRSRQIQLLFHNKQLNKTAVLTLVQEGNPMGINDYKYLGRGYDVSGLYAYDKDVKAQVLDCNRLYSKGHIADLINTNHTDEVNITGRTREEYEEAYSTSAGVSGSYSGFTAGVETNFSEASLSSSEHSFGTFRHMTKKQILKINENLKAADLMDCRDSVFINDIKNLNPTELLSKYGTHVMTGFALGGVLEYSMAADVTAMSNSVDWGVAVSAGFEMAGFGATASSSYQQYNSVAKESAGMEEKLVCRGGESQYASTGLGSESTYNQWLASLEDQNKWVLIDYEGSKLIPLWDFIEDPSKKAAVEAEAQRWLTGTSIGQTSNRKSLNTIVYQVKSDLDDEGTGSDNNSEFEWELKVKADNDERMLWKANDTKDYPQAKFTWKKKEGMGYNYETHQLGSPFQLSTQKTHTIIISLTGCKEIDTGKTGNKHEDFNDAKLELTYDMAKDKWVDKEKHEYGHDDTVTLTSNHKNYTIWFSIKLSWLK